MTAFAFWVYVMNEQNPLVENSYTVPVEVRNLDRSLVALNVPQRESEDPHEPQRSGQHAE